MATFVFQLNTANGSTFEDSDICARMELNWRKHNPSNTLTCEERIGVCRGHRRPSERRSETSVDAADEQSWDIVIRPLHGDGDMDQLAVHKGLSRDGRVACSLSPALCSSSGPFCSLLAATAPGWLTRVRWADVA